MTNEQAINLLKNLHKSAVMHDGDVVALEMAIKALEQDCDTCEVGNPCLYCKHEFEPQESEGV